MTCLNVLGKMFVCPARIAQIDAATLDGFGPDLTFMVDLDPEVGLERTRQRGEDATRFERQPGPFHHKLRNAFIDIAKADPERCVILDGAQSPAEVAARAFAELRSRLELSA